MVTDLINRPPYSFLASLLVETGANGTSRFLVTSLSAIFARFTASTFLSAADNFGLQER